MTSKVFYSYICSLKHVVKVQEGLYDEALSHIVYRKLKLSLKDIVWKREYKDVFIDCFVPILNSWSKSRGDIKSFLKFDDKACTGLINLKGPLPLQNVYEVVFEDGSKVYATLNEANLYRHIYTNEDLYTSIGKEGCLAIDVSLAKGGTEATVESVYSSMSSQNQTGPISNETLSLRTKIHWSMPNALLAERAVAEIAKIYIKGDKDKGLREHKLPIIQGSSANKYKHSKVVNS